MASGAALPVARERRVVKADKAAPIRPIQTTRIAYGRNDHGRHSDRPIGRNYLCDRPNRFGEFGVRAILLAIRPRACRIGAGPLQGSMR